MPAAERRASRLECAERRLAIMGCTGHLVVLATAPSARALLDRGEERLRQLEARWSAFDHSSEVSLLGVHAGHVVAVSDDTQTLLEAARLGWTETGGDFDPLATRGVADGPTMASVIVDRTSRSAGLPAGVSFDPAGIGKGLAADLVASELRRGGAAAVLVSVGGDLRAIGSDPADPDRGWRVDIEIGSGSAPLTIGVSGGGVATSSIWSGRSESPSEPQCHVLDPRTGRLLTGSERTATALAPEAWRAEVWTKTVLNRGDDGLARAERSKVAALSSDGVTVRVNPSFSSFLPGRGIR